MSQSSEKSPFVRKPTWQDPWPFATRSSPDSALFCSFSLTRGLAGAERADSLNKLSQESHIARIELSNFADAVLHHCDALEPHAEGEAGDLLGVVCGLPDGSEGEDRRVHHAAAEQLDPAGVLAFAAALAAAEDAADLHIGTGLGE